MALAILIGVSVLSVLVAVHRYLWRRLVKDVSRKGGPWRRTGTVLVWLFPATTVATLIVGRSGAPFEVEQVLAWPGYLWLALLLYLTLVLLLGELVRPLLRRAFARRFAPQTRPAFADTASGTPVPEGLRGSSPVREPGGEVPAEEATGAAAPADAP
ncbi:hypothetical protein N566_02790, partial [Streptomycetaceae bacterium MP113-05]